MATLQEIAEAIQSIEEKKQTLKNAFEDLQNHSHSLSSFSLSWPQIDSHFSQIQSSLLSRFSLLENKEQSLPQSQQHPLPQTPPNTEIRSICEKMEAPKLMNWVKKNLKSKDEGLIELGLGLKFAPDPFKLVLDAIEGSNPKGKAFVVLLEALMRVEGVNVSVCGEGRERAKGLALKWRENVIKEGNNPLEVLGFLNFLGCYKLVEEFGKDDVLGLVHIASKNAKMIKLCRFLGLEEMVPDVVQKLISEGKRLMAVRFVSEFKLLDKFSPVELLQSYLKDAKKVAQQLRSKGKSCPKSLDQADEREVNALKTVLRYVRDFKFESDYPPEPLEKRIKRIEELKSNRKSKLPIKPPKTNQKKQKTLRKQAPVTRGVPIPAVTSGIPTNVGVSSLPQSQLPYSQPPVLSAGQLGLGSSSVGSYAFPGSMANAPYVGPGNLLYGLASSLVAYANNPSSAGSHLYAPGSQLPSSSYVGPSPSEGYGLLPQQHQPYHPQ